MAIASIGSLCSAIFRGFERLSWHARTTVFGNVLEAAVLVPTLLLGGRLRAALIAQLVAASITTAVQIALMLRLGMGRPQLKLRTIPGLLRGGLGFLVLDLVLRLQPYIDASFLAKLARPEAMGWYSAANRIVGALLVAALENYLASYGSWVAVLTGGVFIICVLAFRRGNDTERKFWIRALERGEIGANDLDHAIGLMTKHRALEDTISRAHHYGAMAVDALALFPSSPMKTALEEVVAFCLARSH